LIKTGTVLYPRMRPRRALLWAASTGATEPRTKTRATTRDKTNRIRRRKSGIPKLVTQPKDPYLIPAVPVALPRELFPLGRLSKEDKDVFTI
jgi:hypothetical protein